VPQRIDWSEIARKLGEEQTLASGAMAMSAGPNLARTVLERLLGNAALEDAVETAAQLGQGAGAAESVLGLLRSRHATEYCYRRFAEAQRAEERVGYAHALRCCAHGVALGWLDRLWADEDEQVQVLAAKMLEGMINAGAIEPDEASEALERGSRHASPNVREYVGYARAAFDRVFGED